MSEAAYYPDARPGRSAWLVTLADLTLLLLGFFVLVAAHQGADRAKLAQALRAGFAPRAAPLKPARAPMPVAAAALTGFAPGLAVLPEDPARLAGWARRALADPRVDLRLTGFSDGTPADADPLTGSNALLAADRARALAVALVRQGAVPRDRLRLASEVRAGQRAVVATLGFAGGGKPLPAGNPLLPVAGKQ